MKRLALIVALLAIAATGCSSLAPRTSARLDEARVSIAQLRDDAEVGLFATAQARHAEETLERALEASNTLQDPALVDHLAYLAKQRAAIARATAARVSAEQRLQATALRRIGGRS